MSARRLADLVGQEIEVLVSPDHGLLISRLRGRLERGGDRADADWVVTTPTGSVRWPYDASVALQQTDHGLTFVRLRPEHIGPPPPLPDVPAAIAQLRRSERGTEALSTFCQMIADGGGGLDPDNWGALGDLCQAFQLGSANPYVLADKLKPRSRSR